MVDWLTAATNDRLHGSLQRSNSNALPREQAAANIGGKQYRLDAHE